MGNACVLGHAGCCTSAGRFSATPSTNSETAAQTSSATSWCGLCGGWGTYITFTSARPEQGGHTRHAEKRRKPLFLASNTPNRSCAQDNTRDRDRSSSGMTRQNKPQHEHTRYRLTGRTSPQRVRSPYATCSCVPPFKLTSQVGGFTMYHACLMKRRSCRGWTEAHHKTDRARKNYVTARHPIASTSLPRSHQAIGGNTKSKSNDADLAPTSLVELPPIKPRLKTYLHPSSSLPRLPPGKSNQSSCCVLWLTSVLHQGEPRKPAGQAPGTVLLALPRR